MLVTVDIPDALASRVREAVGGDLGRAAVEELALKGYRAGKLTRFEVQQLLGLDNRWDTERWLGRRGASMNYSLSDLESDRGTLDRLLGQPHGEHDGER